MLQDKFYEANVPHWDIMLGYDFMISNPAGALPHPATLIRKANQRPSWLLTHSAPGGSQ